MSKTTRRLLGRAAGSLQELDALRAKYPEVQAELDALLGPDGVAALDRAAAMVREAAERAGWQP